MVCPNCNKMDCAHRLSWSPGMGVEMKCTRCNYFWRITEAELQDLERKLTKEVYQ